jgi:acyl-CoA reductase-like NAD-dependent aldehyde dehydrogenase
VLELGGNDPIIVMEDADLDEAARSPRRLVQELGQRCTASSGCSCTKPSPTTSSSSARRKDDRLGPTAIRLDPHTDMGTVIERPAAMHATITENRAAINDMQVAPRPPVIGWLGKLCGGGALYLADGCYDSCVDPQRH